MSQSFLFAEKSGYQSDFVVCKARGGDRDKIGEILVYFVKFCGK
jgi:hypothetical protein